MSKSYGTPGWSLYDGDIEDDPEEQEAVVLRRPNPDEEYGAGLDLSTASTGIFRIQGGNFEHGIPWVIKCEPGERRPQRMADAIKAYLADKHLTWACVEEVYQGKNVFTYKQLVAVRTLVVAWLEEQGIIVYHAYTAQVDSACGIPHGERKERKRATRTFAEHLYGKLPEDPADALCLAYYGYHERRKDRWLAGDVTP